VFANHVTFQQCVSKDGWCCWCSHGFVYYYCLYKSLVCCFIIKNEIFHFSQQLIIWYMTSGRCCRLVIQDKPFAAPLRLIAAGLDLHSLPLAPPPFKQQGLTCVPILPGTDTHSTAAAQGGLWVWDPQPSACCFTCIVYILGHQAMCVLSAHALVHRWNPNGAEWERCAPDIKHGSQPKHDSQIRL